MTLLSLIVLLHLIVSKLKKSKILLLLSFAILFILLAYRSVTVGTDTINYNIQFNVIKSFGFLNIEPLWLYLNKFAIALGGNFQLVLVFASLLTLLPVFYVVNKKSPLPFLSIFLYLSLYYYFFSFNIMRQCIAMSFGLLSIMFFNDNKIKKSLFFLLIAVLFHYSAIVLIPGIIMIKFLSKLKALQLSLLQLFTLFIGVFFSTSIVSVSTKYFYSNYNIEESLNFLGNFIVILALNILFYILGRLNKNKNQWYYFCLIFLYISNILALVPYGNRVVMYYGILFIIFFPLVLKDNLLEKKYNHLFFALIILFGVFNFFINFGKGEIFPYTNILFHD